MILTTDQQVIQSALLSAKSRYENDSFYHKLFFTLIVLGFSNPTIKQTIGQILASENEHLCNVLERLWDTSPIDGVSMETWSIFFNAIIDGFFYTSNDERRFRCRCILSTIRKNP